ncbi:MAG TPA: DinB family protein [Chitinophagaceae bacterium]|nr:DinB family protein [Chitinophagaceae bacterium]
MKELLQQLASYNSWANQRLMDFILTLPEEKQQAEIPSSFNSLQKTILHMWDAESIWWQRMKLHERFVRPSDNFKGSTRDVVNGLMSQCRLWEGWVKNAAPHVLDHVFEYRNNKKEQVKLPIYQMLLHVFNHDTYHRGQLVNMLRQLGAEKLPQTDFAAWVPLKK